MTTPADLATDTAVTPLAKVPGTYLAQLPDHWSYFHPSGGALVTIALRAMVLELGDGDLEILSASTLFCSPIRPGELVIEVKVLRRGDTATQIRASLTQRSEPGPGLEVLATFARARSGPDLVGISMPLVPSPSECATTGRMFDSARAPFTFARNFEGAQALGDPMWKKDWQPGEAHIAHWYRYIRPQRTPSGFLDPLALPPIADTMPSSLWRKLGREQARFIAPSLDLTIFFLGETRGEWVLVESFAERAREGYAVCSANLWDEEGVLLARAAQSMTIRELRRPRPDRT